MMQSVRWPAIAFAFNAFAVPAAATPPDMIDIQDELFGAGVEEVLLLRTVTDNLGSYFNSVSTVFLVSIDVTTGEETFWPVHRTRVQPSELGDADTIQTEVLTETLAGPRNPYELLAEKAAIPAAALAFVASPDGVIEQLGESLSIRHPDGAAFILPSDKLLSDLEALVDHLARQIEPYGRPRVLRTGDLFAGEQYKSEDCAFDQDRLVRFPENAAPIQLVRVTCGKLEDGLRLSAIRIMPEAQSSR